MHVQVIGLSIHRNPSKSIEIHRKHVDRQALERQPSGQMSSTVNDLAPIAASDSTGVHPRQHENVRSLPLPP
jgi:hypothetical protein